MLAFDDFTFDEIRYELSRAGQPLKVDAQVLELLAYLLRNPARVVTKEELIAEVWQGRALSDNVISVSVAKLRKVLGGSANRCIGNVYGRGYRFVRPVHKLAATTPAVSLPSRVAMLEATRAPALVGRAAVMGRLKGALEQARGRRTRVCALLGEAGIGKTRLAEELEAEASKVGFRVSWGRCHAFGDVPPLWPWQQIVRAHSAQLPADASTTPFDGLLRDHDHEAEAVDAPSQPLWAAPGSWHETLSWTSEFVARNCAHQPWLIVLEDVQWADAASLQLLAHVVVEAAQLPLLFVITVRDNELPTDRRCRQALDYVLGHRSCERIELKRLQMADIEAYTADLFGSAQAGLSEAIFAKSEGNPFFMVELLRPWVDGPVPDASDLKLSGAALDIVRQSLRGLEPEAHELLSAASILGRSFDLGLLAAVTQRTHESLIELIDGAITAHVLVPVRDKPTAFAFGHDLIRSVLYEDLASLTRMRLHERVADALVRRQAAGSAAPSAEIAHHMLSALPCGDINAAVSYAQRAARDALRLGAHADAGVYLQRALDAMRVRTDADPRRLAGVLYQLTHCERAAGGPAFAAHLQEAVALAQRHAFGDILGGAGQFMSSAPGTVGMPGAAEVLEGALKTLPADDCTTRAMVLAHMSWTSPYCLDSARVNTLLREAELLAEKAANAAKRTVLRAKLFYAGGPDDHEKALELAASLEQLSAARGARQQARWSLEPQLARVVTYLQQGEFTQAQRAVDAFGAAAHELHHAELIWHYERMCVVLRMNFGEFAWAKTRLVELKERADRLQLHARGALEAIDWGELFRQTTDISPFAGKLARQLQIDLGDGPSVRATKLRGLVQLGLVDAARTQLQAIPVRDLYALPKSRDYLATLGYLAFASVGTQLTEHAAACYELLSPYPRECVASLSFHCFGVVSHFLGTLSCLLGEHARAIRHFEDALVEHERLGMLPRLASTRFELGRLLLESGSRKDQARGRALLEEVRLTTSQLGMAPLLTAAGQLLEGAGQATG